MDGARIGNFVETKKTSLGRDSKANHFTYLGDAEVGDEVNICLLYTSPSPRDKRQSRMPSSA